MLRIRETAKNTRLKTGVAKFKQYLARSFLFLFNFSKNNLIFEGDIVKSKLGGNFVIFYDEACYWLCGNNPFIDERKVSALSFRLNVYLPEELEIIGNVFKNPEILERQL